MGLSATTKLEAINTLLASIGEAPINDPDSTSTVSASIARNTINEISRQVQTQGWAFNTESDYPLTKDSQGYIRLSENIVSVDVAPNKYPSVDATQRGTLLYDKKNHTYIWNSDLKADVVFLLDWEELPEPARYYITVRAARTFQDRQIGSQILHAFNESDELQAKTDLLSWDCDTGNLNIFKTYSAARPLNR